MIREPRLAMGLTLLPGGLDARAGRGLAEEPWDFINAADPCDRMRPDFRA